MADVGSMEVKVPYEPTLKRRFELSQDPFTQERVQSLLTAYRELKRDVPFFAGITAFGSLTKGKVLNADSAKKTDIDLFLFVDREKYDAMIGEFIERDEFKKIYDEVVAHRPAALGSSEFVRFSNIERAVNEYLNERIKRIVEASIDSERRPDTLIEYGAGPFDFISSNSDEPESIFGWVTDDFGGPPASSLEENLFIAGPLLFDIGGGMRVYRESFMQKMMSLPPDEQNRHWKTTVTAMKEWERKGSAPEELQSWYPDSFADAVAVYKPKVGDAPNVPEITG